MVRVGEEGEVAVDVGVDEAGADDLAAGVEDEGGAAAGERAEGGDAAIADGEVAAEPGVAGAVEEAAVADQDVEVGTGHEGWFLQRRVGAGHQCPVAGCDPNGKEDSDCQRT